MFNPAAIMLRNMRAVAMTYTDSAGSFPVQVAVTETDKAFRTNMREEVIGSNVVLTMAKDARVRRGGAVEAPDGRRFRLDNPVPSGVPGLVDWGAARIAGEAVPVIGFKPHVPMNDTITIAGSDVACNVNDSVETEEVGPDGRRMVKIRTMVAIHAADAAGVKAGDTIQFRGRGYRLNSHPMLDGIGFAKILL